MKRLQKKEKRNVRKYFTCRRKYMKTLKQDKQVVKLLQNYKRYMQKKVYNLSLKSLQKTRKQLKIKSGQKAIFSRDEKNAYKHWTKLSRSHKC